MSCVMTIVSKFPSPSGENVGLDCLIFATGGVLSKVNSGDFTTSGSNPFEYFAVTTA